MSSAFDEPIGGPAGQSAGQSVGQSGQAGNAGLSETSKNQTIVFFTIVFKVAALFSYLFGTLIISNFALVFVVTTILLAADFWFVKNVSGRVLVGLRWWSKVQEDGSNKWVFETKPPSKVVHPVDSMAFWTSLYVAPVVWTIMGIAAIASFGVKSLLVVAVALTLSGSNLVGYMKCSKDAKKRIQGFLINQL